MYLFYCKITSEGKEQEKLIGIFYFNLEHKFFSLQFILSTISYLMDLSILNKKFFFSE